MKTLRYKDAAWGLLCQAVEELGEGDCRQASEKGWGAAAQMVKAVAESRGCDYEGHSSLFSVIDMVVNETGDDQICSDFLSAYALNQNIYENWLPQPLVACGLEQVTRLLGRLDAPDVLGGGA